MTGKKLEKANKLKAKIDYLKKKIEKIDDFLNQIDDLRGQLPGNEIKSIDFRNIVIFKGERRSVYNDDTINQEVFKDDDVFMHEIVQAQYDFQNNLKTILLGQLSSLEEEFNEL